MHSKAFDTSKVGLGYIGNSAINLKKKTDTNLRAQLCLRHYGFHNSASLSRLQDVWGSASFHRWKNWKWQTSQKPNLLYDIYKRSMGDCIVKKNIKNSFRKCDIFPLDPAQYPIRRFSLTAMQKYKEWPRN